IRAVRGDEGGEVDHARVGEELRHLADTPDVLGAVLGREAEVVVQAVADVVAVEDVGAGAALPERLLERDRDGGLPGAGEAREPHRATAVAEDARALVAAHLPGMPDDVRGLRRLGIAHPGVGSGPARGCQFETFAIWSERKRMVSM